MTGCIPIPISSGASAFISPSHKALVALGLLGFLLVGAARAIRPVWISDAVDELVAGATFSNSLFWR